MLKFSTDKTVTFTNMTIVSLVCWTTGHHFRRQNHFVIIDPAELFRHSFNSSMKTKRIVFIIAETVPLSVVTALGLSTMLMDGTSGVHYKLCHG